MRRRGIAAVFVLAAGFLVAGAPSVSASTPNGAAAATYGDFSRMFDRSAGQYFSGGTVAGQWAWNPQSPTTSDISWGDPATWPPASAEHFILSGNWVELDGYSGGAGQPVTEVQRVSSETIGDANCANMVPLPSDGGRQHYVQWTIPVTGYCLDAVGTITSTVNGSVVHFEHKQQWGAPVSCTNSYHPSGQTCITQHEQWSDDNGHSYRLEIDRTQYIAQGLGMAFEIRNTVPADWAADGNNYWTW